MDVLKSGQLNPVACPALIGREETMLRLDKFAVAWYNVTDTFDMPKGVACSIMR
jgi:hypothetical protein